MIQKVFPTTVLAGFFFWGNDYSPVLEDRMLLYRERVVGGLKINADINSLAVRSSVGVSNAGPEHMFEAEYHFAPLRGFQPSVLIGSQQSYPNDQFDIRSWNSKGLFGGLGLLNSRFSARFNGVIDRHGRGYGFEGRLKLFHKWGTFMLEGLFLDGDGFDGGNPSIAGVFSKNRTVAFMYRKVW